MVPLDSFAEALTQTWLLTHTGLFDIGQQLSTLTSQIWRRKLPSDIPCFVPSRQAWLEALRTSSYIFLLRIIFQLGLSWTLMNLNHFVNLVWKVLVGISDMALDSHGFVWHLLTFYIGSFPLTFHALSLHGKRGSRPTSYIFLLRIIFQLGLSWTLTNFHHSVNLVWKRHGATRQSQLDSAAMTSSKLDR